MKTRYFAFVDPASGGARDSMTLAIAHVDGEKVILDLLRERKPPFRPSEVVADYCEILQRYKCDSVTGDRFASGFAAEQFAKGGIRYEVSARSKSELFADLLPLINSGTCELLENDRLTNQLQALERRTSRGGRDQIASPPAGFDDLANAAAGALTLPGKGPGELHFMQSLEGPLSPQEQANIEQEEETAREARRKRRERESSGSGFFQDSLNSKKKLF